MEAALSQLIRVKVTMIFPSPLIASGTKVFLLNCQFLVFTTPSLNGFLAFYLIGQLQLGSMATSLNLILSTQVYLRALLSLLFCSSSS